MISLFIFLSKWMAVGDKRSAFSNSKLNASEYLEVRHVHLNVALAIKGKDEVPSPTV